MFTMLIRDAFHNTMLESKYNNGTVNLARGVAYVGGRTSKGRVQVAGTDGR